MNWNDKAGDFHYSIGATMSYLNSEVVNVNQAYQEYDYLYTKGNRVGQMYGLEAIGFFNSQQEINNSPQQTFSGIAPGDVKYKDQNGDNRIDEKDVVKMFVYLPHRDTDDAGRGIGAGHKYIRTFLVETFHSSI